MKIPTVLSFLAIVVPGLALAAQPAQTDLERLRQAEVVIVRGSADHMEQVMRRTHMKYVVVDPADLPQLPLHGQQVLMVNCTGEMGPASRERVRRFVTAGGLLYTTDHAVHYLIEKIFPGYIKWNGKTSMEQIFPMEVAGDQGLLQKIGSIGHPRWQVASGGYLFDVVNTHAVEVLMSSKQVGARYGAPALGVRFHVGDGQVVHVTGHFFTQPGQRPEVADAGRAFEQMSENVVAEKRGDNDRINGLYNQTPKQAVVMRSAPEPSAAPAASMDDLMNGASGGGGKNAPQGVSTDKSKKLRVLERRAKASKVRDTEGNEGWVDNDAL
jgi:hypothetical protein